MDKEFIYIQLKQYSLIIKIYLCISITGRLGREFRLFQRHINTKHLPWNSEGNMNNQRNKYTQYSS